MEALGLRSRFCLSARVCIYIQRECVRINLKVLFRGPKFKAHLFVALVLILQFYFQIMFYLPSRPLSAFKTSVHLKYESL